MALAVALVFTMAGVSVVAEGGRGVAAAEGVLSNTLGFGEPLVGTDISGLGGQQYHQNNQRNFWWNEYKQRWDGILPTASPPAASSSAWWLWHGLDGTPTPVHLVESAAARTPDAFWDADARLLYVFFSRGNSGTSKFRRFAYDPVADRYTEQSRSGGVDAPTRLRGGKRVTIIKSPNGYLWAGVNSAETNEILLSRSTDGGNTWPEPVKIKSTAIGGEGHWVTFNVGGATHVGFAATEDGQAPGGEARVHFIHLNENEANWMNPAKWSDETGLLPGWEGDERADDELSAVAFENRVFIAIETEPLGESRKQARPQLIVYERQAGGGWLKHVILRYAKSADDAKRPVITVDASARLLIVSGGTTQRTHADLWYAPIDSLAGRDEQWATLRVFQVDDPAKEDIYTSRLPLPRFPVTAESNLPVLIDDRGVALRMWRQVVRSSGGGGDPGTPNQPPVISSVMINQSAPRTNDTLTVTVSASDPDGDPLSYSYQWLKNGSSISGATAATLDLSVPGNGDKGDRIAVRVTAFDGRDSSEPVTSEEVTVVNSPPVFNQDLGDRTNSEGDTVAVSAAAGDPDGDALTYTAGNLPSEVSIDGATGLIAGTIADGTAGVYNVQVQVTDGSATAVDTFAWTVVSSAPPAPPSGLAATATTTEVLLDWDDSPEASSAGFRVYRSAASGGPYTLLTPSPLAVSNYTDAAAPPGTSFYRVTAVNTGGQESGAAETSVANRIVLRSVAQATARDALTMSIPRPAGVSSGDVLIAGINVSGAATISATGWTLVQETLNGSRMQQAVYYRIATSSEPASYSFSFSATASTSGTILSYVGVDGASPVDATSGQANPSSRLITAPAVTTTGSHRVLLGFFGVATNANNGVTPPPDMIERADVIQGQGPNKLVLEAADVVLPFSGNTGSRTATVDKAGVNIGQLVALRPQAQ